MAENPLGAVAAFDATLKNATKPKRHRKRAPKATTPYKPPKPAAQTIASSGPLSFEKAIPAARNPGLNRRVPHINRLVRQIAFRPAKRDAAFNTLRGLNLTDAEVRYAQIELRKLAPTLFSAHPSVAAPTAAQSKQSEAFRKSHPGYPYSDPGFAALPPEKLKWLGREAAINRRNQAELEAIVNPFSGQNIHALGDMAWEMTGIPTLSHPIRSGAVDTGLAALGFVPGVGGLTKLGRFAKLDQASRVARAARRGPRMTPEEARAHVLDLAQRAAEEPLVQAKMGHPKVPRVEPGTAPPELGGVPGQKIRGAMNRDLTELRAAQKEAQSVELGAKSGRLRKAQAAAMNAPDPWKAALAARGVLKGKLATKEFTGFESLTLDDRLEILQHVDSLNLRPFERDNLLHAIDDGINGVVPQKYEAKLIARAFGVEKEDLAATIRAGGFKKALVDFINIPRAIKSSGDLSWGLRQALATLFYDPKLWGREFGKMFKAAGSEAEAQARMAAIHNDPLYPLAVKDGLPLTELGSAERGVANISRREEAIMSNWAEHLHELPGVRATPGVKQAAHGVSAIVRASDRGYVVPLNGTRMALYDRWLHQAAENGWVLTPKLRKDLANVAGALTGRGHLPSSLAKHRAAINAVFWSPGLMASRINMLNPFWYAKLEPFARQQALKSMRNLMGTLALTLFAAEQAGARVEWDPRSSDFGKPRIGDTRLDIGGGFSQYLTLASRLATQQTVSSTTGKTTNLSGDAFGVSDWDIIQNFFGNKAAPPLAEAMRLGKQSNFGEPLTPTGELANIFAPLALHDIYSLAKTDGPGGGPKMAAALALPDLFGLGIQNYSPHAADSPEKVKKATSTALTETRKQMNTLNVPAKYRPLFAKAARMKVERDLAKDQARKMSPDGSITDLDSFRITMDTLARNGVIPASTAKRAVASMEGKTDREIRHWEYEAWQYLSRAGNEWGPGRYLEWLHSEYNKKTGE